MSFSGARAAPKRADVEHSIYDDQSASTSKSVSRKITSGARTAPKRAGVQRSSDDSHSASTSKSVCTKTSTEAATAGETVDMQCSDDTSTSSADDNIADNLRRQLLQLQLLQQGRKSREKRAHVKHVYWLRSGLVDGLVNGVTQLHDVIYIVCLWSSTILTFSSTTRQRLKDIDVEDLKHPSDIVACERTSLVYVADRESECVWRVSSDGADIRRWLPKSPSDTLKPEGLSLTSSRLLVTSRDSKQLILFDAGGHELERVLLPDHMKPWHAVESPAGTFIVSHQYQVSEVNTEGQVLHQFSSSGVTSLYRPSLGCTHLAVDSQGNVFVADWDNCRILLLDAQLALSDVIIDKDLDGDRLPGCLCYMEQSGELLVGFAGGVMVFGLLRP